MVQGFLVGKTACGCPVWLSPVCLGLPRKHACFLLLSTFVCGHVDQGVMKTGILVCGLNGSGKSTLGRALAQALGFTFLDSEDVFFSKADPNTCQKRPARLIARWPFRALTKVLLRFLQVVPCILASTEISHLRVRPGGFPIAPWAPSVPYLLAFLQVRKAEISFSIYA